MCFGEKGLDKELLQAKAVREIISLVATGEYRQGQKLPAERSLCEQLNLSRGTLRKAFSELESMGVIKVIPQSGAYVQEFSHEEIPSRVLPVDFKGVSLNDIILARKAIEVAAIEIVADRVTQEDIAEFEDIVVQMEKSQDKLQDFIKYDMKFHELIVRMSKNRVLVTAYNSISQYHKYSQVYSGSYGDSQKTALMYHRKIVKSLGGSQSWRAVKTLVKHLDNMLESIKKVG